NDRRRVAAARVISEPFPERPLVACFVSRNPAFNNNFGGGWKRQTGVTLNHLDCFAFQPSCDLELAHAIRDLQARYKKQHRIVSHRDHHRAILTAGPIPLHDETAVFARGDVESGGLFVVDGHAIDSDVDPVAVRIFLYDDASGADVTVSIMFVPLAGKIVKSTSFPLRMFSFTGPSETQRGAILGYSLAYFLQA